MTEKENLINLLQQVREEKCDYDGNIGIGTIADYLIANGVIAPPVKVGDVVYHIFSADNIKASIVKRIQHGKYGTKFADAHGVFDVLRIGKDIFLTKEQADAYKNTVEDWIEREVDTE